MVDYREILRLNSLEYTQTQIAEALHSSRNTIREVIKLARDKNVCWPLDESLTNPRLHKLLYPERSERVHVYMEPDCPHVHAELARQPYVADLVQLSARGHAKGVGYVRLAGSRGSLEDDVVIVADERAGRKPRDQPPVKPAVLMVLDGLNACRGLAQPCVPHAPADRVLMTGRAFGVNQKGQPLFKGKALVTLRVFKL